MKIQKNKEKYFFKIFPQNKISFIIEKKLFLYDFKKNQFHFSLINIKTKYK